MSSFKSSICPNHDISVQYIYLQLPKQCRRTHLMTLKFKENIGETCHIAFSGIFPKNTSQEMTKGERNLVSRLVFSANTPHNMIYLFNYTEY
jgi:hypothetical protein